MIKTSIISRILTWVAGAVLTAPAVLIVCVLFVYPFLLSVRNSFYVKQGWSLQNYLAVWGLYRGDIAYTVLISLASLAVLMLIAVCLGGYLRLHPNGLIEFLFKVPLFVPYAVVGHAMRVLLAPHGTLNALLALLGLVDLNHPPSIATSAAGVGTALVWKNMSIAVLLITGAFRAVDDSFLEAAYNVGARGLRTIFSFLVPMSKGAIVVSAVLIFTAMMGCFSIPVMLGSGSGPQVLMVDLYYEIVYQNNYGTANAIGVFSYLISMGAAAYYLKMVNQS